MAIKKKFRSFSTNTTLLWTQCKKKSDQKKSLLKICTLHTLIRCTNLPVFNYFTLSDSDRFFYAD